MSTQPYKILNPTHICFWDGVQFERRIGDLMSSLDAMKTSCRQPGGATVLHIAIDNAIRLDESCDQKLHSLLHELVNDATPAELLPEGSEDVKH